MILAASALSIIGFLVIGFIIGAIIVYVVSIVFGLSMWR